MTLNYANILSAIRMILSPIIFISIVSSNFQLSLELYLVALITDFADGYYARKNGTCSNRGALLDVSGDFLLILSGLSGFVILGKIGLWVIIVTLFMFGQFVLTFSGKIVYDPYGRFFGVFLLFSLPLAIAGSRLALILVNHLTLMLGFTSFIGRLHYIENKVTTTHPVKYSSFNLRHIICAVGLDR